MKKVKISFLWSQGFQHSVLFSILKSLVNVEIVNIEKADLIIVGPQSKFSFKRKILNLLKKKNKHRKIISQYRFIFIKKEIQTNQVVCQL